MPKTVLNLPTKRLPMVRLKAEEALRHFCGWASAKAIPHESKFSRVFDEFADVKLPHAGLLRKKARR